jgi:hypothetical protein
MIGSKIIKKKNILGIIPVSVLALLFLFYSLINILKSAFDDYYNIFIYEYLCYFLDVYLKRLSVNYKQIIFSGLFLHLLFKIIIVGFFSFTLSPIINIITIIIFIIFCSIFDIYSYIYESIGYFGNYFLGTFLKIMRYEESEHLLNSYSGVGRGPLSIENFSFTKYPLSFNNIIDRFFFGLYLFLPFFALRYFILKEPFLFFILNINFFYFYLQDFNIFITYLYFFILHLSRFMFYLSDESFKYKDYQSVWLFLYGNNNTVF